MKTGTVDTLYQSKCQPRPSVTETVLDTAEPNSRGGGTLGISGWVCAAGTLEPLTFTRAS